MSAVAGNKLRDAKKAEKLRENFVPTPFIAVATLKSRQAV